MRTASRAPSRPLHRRPGSASSLDRSDPIRRFAVCAFVSVAAVAAALVSQHVYRMEPCPWCVLQRVIFLAVALACIVGLAWRSATGRAVAATLGLLLALAGIASALWQHFVAAASASCNLTFADKLVGALRLDSWLPEVFSARASCADAAVDLLGVPYVFWSLALFVLLGLALLSVLLQRRPR